MPDYVPALAGRMGDWQYYVTVMKLGKIAKECSLAEEIHANKDLDEQIQREIGKRVEKEMVPYLLNEKQRFYGALVVAVYGGEPAFSPVTVNEHDLLDDKEGDTYGFGLLRFDGSQVYYALDGQHRLKSIQEAIKVDPALREEQVTVIIIKHEDSRAGMERTRRLFSTLNRRAKPTSAGMNIAIDEDDSIAIVTRQLVKENDTLKKLVLAKIESVNSKQLNPSKSNDPYITTLAAMYETNEILLGAFEGGLTIDKDFKQFRRSYEDTDAYFEYLRDIWMRLLEKCPGFDAVLAGKRKPGDLRRRVSLNGVPVLDENGKPIPGGSVFARPYGQFIIADVLKTVGLQGKSVPDAIDALMEGISMDIDQAPWVNTIWNPLRHQVTGTKGTRALVTNMIRHALGLKITPKIREMTQQYRDTTGDRKGSLLPSIQWSGEAEAKEDRGPEEDDGGLVVEAAE